MIQTETQLPKLFRFSPLRLSSVGQRVPLEDDYIPLNILDRRFPLVPARLQKLGGEAVQLSLERPFGFMDRPYLRGLGEPEVLRKTPKTDGIVLAPADPAKPGNWVATYTTEAELTQPDLELFARGIDFYAAHVEAKLITARLRDVPPA